MWAWDRSPEVPQAEPGRISSLLLLLRARAGAAGPFGEKVSDVSVVAGEDW
jgi:hypothetical protein